MMTLISKNKLQRLMRIEDKCCISIFMPTHPDTAQTEQDQIRFKNLIRQAEKRINETAACAKSMQPALAQGRELLRENSFWRYAAEGLALFLATDQFQPYRLPLKFEELMVTGSRFHIKPLLPLFSSDGRFYVLALSQNEVRMLQCTRFSSMAVDLSELSGGLQAVLNYDDTGKALQFHTGTGLASGDLREIVAASLQGRVDVLFVAVGQQCWGIAAPDAGRVKLRAQADAGSEDLLNRAAVETLMHGGRVFALHAEQVPLEGTAAAIFRF